MRSALLWGAVCLGWACSETVSTGVISIDAASVDVGQMLDVSPPIMDADVVVDATPSQRVYFVSPTGSEEGDGRRRSPFVTLEAAYDVARTGDIVQLLPGRFDSLGAPPEGVIIQGSGADVSIIAGPVELLSQGVALRELGIEGGDPIVTVSGQAELESVTLRDGLRGLHVAGTLVARDVTIRDIMGPAESERSFDGPTPSAGAAVRVGPTGRLQWRSGSLRDFGWVGIRAQGETSLERVTIRDGGGVGVVVDGAMVSVNDGRVERVGSAAMLVLDGELQASGLTLEGIQESPLLPMRCGVAGYGGSVVLERVEISDIDRGLRLSRGVDVRVDTLRVDGPRSDGISVDGARVAGRAVTVVEPGNTGVSAVSEAELDLAELEVEAVGRIGLLVNRSRLNIDGLRISGSDGRGVTLSQAQGTLSNIEITQVANVGIQVTDAAGLVVIDGGVIRQSSTSGVAVTGVAHATELRNLDVSEIIVGEAQLGEGIHLFRGAALLAGVVSHGNAGAGVLVEESTLSTDGVEVRGNAGPGMVFVGSSAETEVRGLVARENAGAGVLVLQGQAHFFDYNIQTTQQDVALGPGDGVVASIQGSVTLTDGHSDNNQGSGYSIQAGCSAVLTNASATGNGAWGLQQACGQSMVELGGMFSLEGNVSGATNLCL